MGLIPGLVHWVKGSGIAASIAQIAAVAWIQSLAQELPYATGVAIKIGKKKKKKEKRKEIMSLGATWMALEIIILSEISQTKKDKYHMTSHAESKK